MWHHGMHQLLAAIGAFSAIDEPGTNSRMNRLGSNEPTFVHEVISMLHFTTKLAVDSREEQKCPCVKKIALNIQCSFGTLKEY